METVKTRVFLFVKADKFKVQVWYKCHTINYLQTKGGAILGNIGSQPFVLYMLPQPWARIPQYGPRTWLIRSY